MLRNPFPRSIVIVGLALILLVSCSGLPQTRDISELSARLTPPLTPEIPGVFFSTIRGTLWV